MKTPNILILMADQLAPHYTGTYGHPLVKTPNVDKLAEQGCRFDAAYTASPLCAPARFAFMSGQFPFNVKAYDNATEFPAAAPTFCHHLRQMGYHACLTGKMHFIGPDQLHGFHERLTTDIYPADFAFTPNWLATDERIDAWYHNMSSVIEAGSAEMTYQLEFDDEVGFHGIRRIYDYARSPEQLPFILVASFTHPHDPYIARQKWWDLYDHNQIDMPNLSINSVDMDAHSKRIIGGIQADTHPPDDEAILNARHAYYANTSYFDDWVGQFVDALKKTNLIDNTVVVVMSDHGDMLGERGLWYKMNFFEHSARIPLIIAGPDITHSTIPNACSTIDILPTLLDFASGGSNGVPDIQQSIDGRSLHSLLTGSAMEQENSTISQYAAECTSHPMVMIRRGDYKYIHCDSDDPMLFNLQEDPGETQNLAADPNHLDIAAAFGKEIAEKWNFDEIRTDVIEKQQARLLIQETMSNGLPTSWDYQPIRDAAEVYVRMHRELDDLAVVSRFPRWSKLIGS